MTACANKIILKNFPKIKLSYETITHKKIYDADFIVAIPEGIKTFAWFKNNKCFILSNNIQEILFEYEYKELDKETIFYGTLFENEYFCIEDILYDENKYVGYCSQIKKLYLLETIFSQKKLNNEYTNANIHFGLPLMHKNYIELKKMIDSEIDIHYKIKYIQYRYFKHNNIYNYNDKCNDKTLVNVNLNNQYNNICQNNINKYTQNEKRDKPNNNNHVNKEKEVVFLVKADVQNDIYHLHTNKNGSMEYYDIAYIPDYNTSIMMNKLFRNIKENENLDELEESDSEDEFENIKNDKFVHLDKEYNMICIYNKKFKKWYPIKLANKNNTITNYNYLSQLEKNKY